jgi:hypothetical protein
MIVLVAGRKPPRDRRKGGTRAMTKHATTTIDHKAWTEAPFAEPEHGPKLARASVAYTYQGDIDGESTLEYLMTYLRDDLVPYLGLEQVSGRIGERSGSFVLRHEGAFEGKTARATVTIVSGSGTGALQGLTGEGSFVWSEGQSGSLTLDYAIE